MPNVFDQLTGEITGSSFTSDLTDQVNSIKTAMDTLSSLASGENVSFDDLLESLGNLNLPSINITADLAPVLSNLGNAVPSDLSSVSGGVDNVLEIFQGGMIEEVIEKVQKFIKAIEAIKKLSESDLSFKAAVTASASGSSSSSSGSATSPTPPSEPAPSESPEPEADPPAESETEEGSPSESSESESAETTEAEEKHSQRMSALNNLTSQLAGINTPYNSISFLQVLHRMVQAFPRENIKADKIPLISDLTNALDALMDFREMDSGVLDTHIETSLTNLANYIPQTGRGPLTEIAASLDDFNTKLDANLFKTQSDILLATLSDVAPAIETADLSPVSASITQANGALDILLPHLSLMKSELMSGENIPLQIKLNRLHVEMERAIRKILQIVNPGQPLKLIDGLNQNMDALMELINPEEMGETIKEGLQKITAVLDAIDASVLGDVLEAPADGLKAASDLLDTVLSELASQTSALFDEVDNVLAEVDINVILAPIQQAFNDFNNLVAEKTGELFSPIQEAIVEGVNTLKTATDQFNPEDIIAALEGLIDSLKDVLEGEDVQNALNSIKQTIDSAAGALESLSFSPVTQGVIDEIDKITRALNAVDPDTLSTETKLALTAAKALLPSSIAPLTDPLVDEVEGLIDAGPKPLVDFIKNKTEALTSQVMQFSPGDTIGSQLSAPYQSFLNELDKFKPSQLLAPLETALENFQDEIKDKANISEITKPLEDIYTELLGQFDKLNPAELLKPLDDMVKEAIAKLVDIVPTDEIFDVLDNITSPIQRGIDMAESFKNALDTLVRLMESLGNSHEEMMEWLSPVFEKVGAIDDVSAYQPIFDQIISAVEDLQKQPITTELMSHFEPLRNSLSLLNAQSLFNQISEKYRGISRAAVEALPVSPERTGLLNILDRFNPLDPVISGVYLAMGSFKNYAEGYTHYWNEKMTHWDLRYHNAEAALTKLKYPAITPQELREILQKGLEDDVVVPLSYICTTVFKASGIVRAPLTAFTEFLDEFTAKVSDLLLGPSALGGIRDNLQALIDKLEGINLQFVISELEEVFNGVKEKLEAISPTVFRELIQNSINSSIDRLDLSLVIPHEQIDAIDGIYQGIIDKLKELDPQTIVVEVVDPLFEETLKPILEKFDVSELLSVVLERLDNLDEELKEEFDKVNTAYVAMVDAIPEAGIGDLVGAIDVDIGF